MIAELGQFCLALALMVSLLQALLPALGKLAGAPSIAYLTKPSAMAGFMLILAAFVVLVAAYAASDFSVLNVVLNSHSDKPLLYKITGSWGNHEGSMLLWATILAAYGFLIAIIRANETALKYTTLGVLGAIQAGFLAFLLFTSNPFTRVWPPALQGEDLNPLLQDIGLALHPPTLYIGYVGFAAVFAYSLAALMRGKLDTSFARTIHPFILLPWSFLTLGIGAGSWWAYRELGWGGWWFWDPVENVSLLPWLSATALLHANMVLEKRGQLARWVALLAILTFSFSLIGTFIVRSGLITSVHAFASDPARGVFILIYIFAVTSTALFIYGRSQISTPPIAIMSRGGFILIGNLLLIAAAVTILFAILYPVFVELLGQPPISVGPHYFNTSVLPLLAPLTVLAALAPLLPWNRTSRAQLRQRFIALMPSAAGAVLICLAITDSNIALTVCGVALALWLLLGVAHYIRGFRRVGLRQMASILGHAGVAVFVLGITATGIFHQSFEGVIDSKTPLTFGDYRVTLLSAERRSEYNYIVREGIFSIAYEGKEIAVLSPQLREYPARKMQTTEAALHSIPWRDLYLVLGDAGEGRVGVRLYIKPFQQWIWAGFILVALGGFAALAAVIRRA